MDASVDAATGERWDALTRRACARAACWPTFLPAPPSRRRVPALGPELIQDQVTLAGFEQPVMRLTCDVATDDLGAVGGEPGRIMPGCAPPARVERRSPVRNAQQGEGTVLGGAQGFRREGRRGKEDPGLDTRFREVLPEGFDVGAPDERLLSPTADERQALPVGSAHYAFELKKIAGLGVYLGRAPMEAQGRHLEADFPQLAHHEDLEILGRERWKFGHPVD